MDTNLNYDHTPQVGRKIKVTVIGYVWGTSFEGKVVHIFPALREIPEYLMRKYYKPKAGSKYDLNPRLLCKPNKYDRVVLEVEPDHYIIYPHQRYYVYEEI